MLKVRPVESFAGKLGSTSIDEPDHAVSAAEGAREPLPSSGAAFESGGSNAVAKVKVVGELLKKDARRSASASPKVAAVAVDAVAPFAESTFGVVDLSSLIVAEDLVIGGSSFAKSRVGGTPKRTPLVDGLAVARKKRVQQRPPEQLAAVSGKAAGNGAASAAPEKHKGRDATKSLVRRTPIARAVNGASVGESVAGGGRSGGGGDDKSCKKLALAVKLGSDAKNGEPRKEAKTSGSLGAIGKSKRVDDSRRPKSGVLGKNRSPPSRSSDVKGVPRSQAEIVANSSFSSGTSLESQVQLAIFLVFRATFCASTSKKLKGLGVGAKVALARLPKYRCKRWRRREMSKRRRMFTTCFVLNCSGLTRRYERLNPKFWS